MVALEANIGESDHPGSLMDSVLAGMITQIRTSVMILPNIQ